MRKKFVTVALLGTLIFTSANFVGCKDYDDDINKLQEQVDALKSISISDLASQLQSLKDANGNLSVANAKMEAAIAEIKTNIDALKEADKTLTSLVNGKVDQATYQAAINALNDKCSDLSNKVAALAALETAVNDLKANKADNSAIEELKKAVEKLQTVDADFATRINKLENTIENMNTVLAGKADQTTVDALAKSIEELKTSVAGIDTKIANALAPIQASVAKLQEDLAKKADAATIAADIAEMKKELNAAIDAAKALAASELAKVSGELAGRIAALETAKEQMGKQITALETNISALEKRIDKLESQPTTDLNEVKESIKANKLAIDGALTTIGSIQGTITGIEDRLDGLGEGAQAVKTYIDDAVSSLETSITSQVTTISTDLGSLKSEYDIAVADFEGRIAALEAIEHVNKDDFEILQTDLASLKTTVGDAESGLVKQLNDLELEVSRLIEEALEATGPGSIEDKIAKQITKALRDSEDIKEAIETAIEDVMRRVENIETDLDAVLERIQSIVFVPQYRDYMGAAIVPVYRIDGKNGTVEMKFRISPVSKVAELVKLGAANPGIFTFYKEDALQSRATSETSLVATEVKAGKETEEGTIIIKAEVSPTLATTSSNNYYPVALKLSTAKEYGTEETPNSKPVNEITTEYFYVRVSQIDNRLKLKSLKDGYEVNVERNTLAINYTQVEEFNFDTDLTLMTTDKDLQLESCGFEPALKVSEVWDAANNKWLSWGKDDASIRAIEVIKNGVFALTEHSIKLTNTDVSFMGKELKVKLADKSLFGVDSEGFELTYKVNDAANIAPVDYGTITKVKDEESTETNFVWSVNDVDRGRTYVVDAEKASRLDGVVAGASLEQIYAAITKAKDEERVTYQLINAKGDKVAAKALDPTFDIWVDGDNDDLIINVPAGAEYKSYKMVTTYATEYGDIMITANLNLSYPGAALLLNREITQWSGDAFVLSSGKATDESKLYTIEDNLALAYDSPAGVTRKYELVKKENGEYKVTSVENVSISGHILTISDKVNLSDFWVKVTVLVEGYVTDCVDYFHVQATFPILADNKLTVTRTGDDKNKGTQFDYTPGGSAADLGATLSLKDRFETELVKAGTVENYAKSVYGMDGELSYKIKSAVVDGSTSVSAEGKFNIENGKFTTVLGYESTKAVTVTVEVSVKHKFGPMSSATLTVVVAKTK